MVESNFINLNEFILQNEIGQGAFGRVYRVKNKNSGIFYAAKVSNKKIKIDSSILLSDISKEIAILSKFYHPSIMKFIGFSPINFKKKLKPVIITELVSNGTLDDLINKQRNLDQNQESKPLSDTMKLIIIYGIASAMLYLHENGIIHRDLKPENILIDEFNFPKIADFGLSTSNKQDDENDDHNPKAIKGTPKYISPEIWKEMKYTPACDVYAFAITIYELITLEKPFEGFWYFEIIKKVINGFRPEFTKQIPESYKNLIERCWAQNMADRPTFAQIVQELKTNPGFITKSIQIDRFKRYMAYIDQRQKSFNSSIDARSLFSSLKKISSQNQINVIDIEKKNVPPLNLRLLKKNSLFPQKEFLELDEECQKLVEESENDPQKQFMIGKYLAEGRDNFPHNTSIALKYLRKSIDSGSNEAVIYYCKMLIKGEIIPRNLKRAEKLVNKHLKNDKSMYLLLLGKIQIKNKNYDDAIKYFLQSIEEGNSEAIYEYGKMLYKGNGVPINKIEAIKYYKKAIDNNCIKAIYRYGQILSNGEGVEKNLEESHKYIKIAADKGYSKAMNEYGLILEKKGSKESYQYFSNAAKTGNATSMLKYGKRLLQSKDNPKDKKECMKYLKMASQKGEIEAMYLYGSLLYENDDSKVKEALKLLRIAAKNKNVEAMAFYGIALIQGKGISADFSEAAKYLLKASKKSENSDALFGLGHLYETGKGVPVDPYAAYNYYKRSAQKKNTDALLRLGNDYFDGQTYGVNVKIAQYCYLKCIEFSSIENDNIAKSFENSYRCNNLLGQLYELSINKNDDPETEKNKIMNAEIRLKKAADIGYPTAQNNYGLLLQFCLKNNEEAIKMYLEADKINYSLPEYNLAYLYEQENQLNKAIEYYIKASDNEKNPSIFRRQKINDNSVLISKSFILCLANLRLVLYYLNQNSKANHLIEVTKYFNRAENNIKFFTESIHNKSFHLDTNGEEIKALNRFNDKIKKFVTDNQPETQHLQKVDECQDSEYDPNKIFSLIEHFIEKFKQIIEETIDDLKQILYEPPYYILYGQIMFKNHVNDIEQSKQDEMFQKFKEELNI